ncbi:hypothetical protein [Microbacterium sp. CIAB417]|uniref:hypothetical protein n=1 Tax=Microbacterium sp. CIAB417 TaxID=2860287 RepID=UPI001FAE01DF|nr:hypothetical protein [Microbacterium sp. CIAB417]
MSPLPAFAADYPSWDDVQAAKVNGTLKTAEITRIRGLIQSLTNEVQRTRATAEQAADAFYAAQQDFFAASQRADALQSQADTEAEAAAEASNRAGWLAAQLYRDGGDAATVELLLPLGESQSDRERGVHHGGREVMGR